jgi:hypothetical protein
MKEYMIVGDTEHGESLILIAGEMTAERALAKVKADPAGYQAAGHKNIRIKVEEIKSAWWNDSFLVH